MTSEELGHINSMWIGANNAYLDALEKQNDVSVLYHLGYIAAVRELSALLDAKKPATEATATDAKQN